MYLILTSFKKNVNLVYVLIKDNQEGKWSINIQTTKKVQINVMFI